MDPITLLGAVAATLKVIKECCETVRWMQRVHESYQNSDQTLRHIMIQCNIYGESIEVIGEWIRSLDRSEFKKQIRTTNNAIQLVQCSMTSLHADLQKIADGGERLSIKVFKHYMKIKHQWFADTMKTHLTELRHNGQTLQLTLTVIQLTKSSVIPDQTQRYSEKLEESTIRLEKRFLFRHFITKALQLRRAEIESELQAKRRLVQQTSTGVSTAPINPTLFEITQQARQRSLSKDMPPFQSQPNDLIDLMDFSEEPTHASSISYPASSHNLENLMEVQRDINDTEKSPPPFLVDESVIPLQPAPQHSSSASYTQSSELNELLSNNSQTVRGAGVQSLPFSNVSNQQLRRTNATNPVTENPNMRDIRLKTNMVDTSSLSSQVTDISNTFDRSSTLGNYAASQLSSLSTYAASISSYPSTLSTNGSSSSGVTEADMAKRKASFQTQGVTSGIPIRRKAIGAKALGNPKHPIQQGSLNSNSTLSNLPSPTIYEDTALSTSATSSSPAEAGATPSLFELPIGTKPGSYLAEHASPDVVADIDMPDPEGFPWIVKAARNGDDTTVKRLLVSDANIKAIHTTTKRNALSEASVQGHENLVNLLIHEGSPLEQVDAESCTALHHACRLGHLAIAKRLIESKAAINAQGPQGQTPLHLAVAAPHQSIIMLLVQHRANVNARDAFQRTALHISATHGNLKMCNHLLANGAQLDIREGQSKTALQLACEAGHFELVEVMLASAKFKSTDLTFLNAFFAAVEYGHVRIAHCFLDRDLNLKKLKSDSHKPAILAAKSGSLDMLDLMIKKNCAIKDKDGDNWNALHFAAYHGHCQVIERLLAKDVSCKATTSKKETPLLLSVKGGHFAAVDILLRNKASTVNVEDTYDEQPFHHATRIGAIEIFNLLISNTAKLNPENSFGWHPIHIAIAYGHSRLVDRLLKEKIDVEEKLGSSSIKTDQTHILVKAGYWAEARWPYPGSRTLHIACEFERYEIALCLIGKGANIEATCSEGWRPLHHAAFNGSPILVQHLLKSGANVHAQTHEGKSALELQFRDSGTPISESRKQEVRQLLNTAMKQTSKQFSFKVSLKKGRTVDEKNSLIRRANTSMEMAVKPKFHRIVSCPPDAQHPMLPSHSAASLSSGELCALQPALTTINYEPEALGMASLSILDSSSAQTSTISNDRLKKKYKRASSFGLDLIQKQFATIKNGKSMGSSKNSGGSSNSNDNDNNNNSDNGNGGNGNNDASSVQNGGIGYSNNNNNNNSKLDQGDTATFGRTSLDEISLGGFDSD